VRSIGTLKRHPCSRCTADPGLAAGGRRLYAAAAPNRPHRMALVNKIQVSAS
jgi:hypothetical protein